MSAAERTSVLSPAVVCVGEWKQHALSLTQKKKVSDLFGVCCSVQEVETLERGRVVMGELVSERERAGREECLGYGKSVKQGRGLQPGWLILVMIKCVCVCSGVCPSDCVCN